MSETVQVEMKLPERKRGRRSAREEETYQADLHAFCDGILEIKSRLDFKVSSRGWCYILEQHGLSKGDFDKAQRLINDCRKSGRLPLDIAADDSARATDGVQDVDYSEPEDRAREIVREMDDWVDWYTPRSFWDTQDVYVEMMVEKIDLKSLFSDVCSHFYVPLTNSRGWSDLNSRAAMMRRFRFNEGMCRRCILLHAGDFDPGGLQISGFIRSNLEELSGAVGWTPDNLVVDRFGLNYDFIMENNLSWIENLETASGGRLDDPRHKDHGKPYAQDYLRRYGVRKVEANALVVRPEQGRELCRQAVLKYVSEEAVQEYNDYLEEQQDLLREKLPDAVREYLKGV
jgi:hypothetical protein